MPYVSILPSKSVPGLSVFIALTRGSPVPAAEEPLGPETPRGLGGHLPAPQALPQILPRRGCIRTGTKYMWLSRSYVFASNCPWPRP